ncbi:MAG: DUF433 domain-containing protein [Xanthobacteraceae bacterium]
MPARSKKELVAKFTQVVENVEQYQRDLEVHADLAARMSRHPAWYAVRTENGRWLFGPSKFVGYAGISAKQYLGSYDRRDGGETERALSEWFDTVDLDSVLGRELEFGFRNFLAHYSKIPHKRRRISVAKDQLGVEVSGNTGAAAGSKALTDRITVNPEVCGGRPCIRGTRVRVSDILDMISHGVAPEEIVRDYPYLDRADIAAAFAYAAHAVDHRVVKAA